jgi:hypothetical protein
LYWAETFSTESCLLLFFIPLVQELRRQSPGEHLNFLFRQTHYFSASQFI